MMGKDHLCPHYGLSVNLISLGCVPSISPQNSFSWYKDRSDLSIIKKMTNNIEVGSADDIYTSLHFIKLISRLT